MSIPTLRHPVRTLDNLLLLPAGTALSEETLDALISSSGATSHHAFPLLRHGSVKEDLLHFISPPPYQVLFSGQEQIADLMNIMETVRLVKRALVELFQRWIMENSKIFDYEYKVNHEG